jgi:raffinose/stachyose/melibiose transport system permease protein
MRSRKIEPYLYILPALVLVVVFIYYPIIQNFYFSFFQMSSFSEHIRFISGNNYFKLFTDNVFYIALKNNFLYAIFSLLFQVGLGLMLAIFLESKYIGKLGAFFRSVYFIPSLFSVTAVCMLWQFIYEPNMGLINSVVRFLGYNDFAFPWLANSKLAIFSIIAMSQWQYTGYTMLLLIVAIQKIPDELYESAEIDGANNLRKTLNITIPQIKEMLLVTCIITVIGSFKLFTEVYATTLGGPGNKTQVLGVYLYQNAFQYDKMGYAAAIAVIIFLITFLLSLLQIKLSKSGEI